MPIEDNNSTTTTTTTVFVGEPAEEDFMDKLRALAASGNLSFDDMVLHVPKIKEPVSQITMPEVEARAITAPDEDVEGRKRKKKSIHEGRKKMKKSVLALEKHIISLRKRFFSLEKHLMSLEKRYKKFARYAKKPKTRNV